MNLPVSAKHGTLISVTVIGVVAVFLAATAEALYAPLVKLISADTGVMMSVAFIFFGAGCGLLIILLFGRKSKTIFDPERHLRKKDTWKILLLILLAMLGTSLLNIGIQQESAASASILQNVTTVVTVLFAALFLKEKISKRLGIGVALIVLGSVALAITNLATLSFSAGSLFIIAGCTALGGNYLVSKLLADRNPVECTIIRGAGAGVLALIIALSMGESLPSFPLALGLMATGFIGCGLSAMLLMYGQRHLGAAKAGAIYGVFPLIGVILAIPVLGEMPTASLLAALILFIPGMYFVITKHSGKEAAEASPEPDAESGMKDAEYIKSISEQRKTGMKNQLTSLGLLVIAIFFVMMVLGVFGSGTADAAADLLSSGQFILSLILGVFLFLIGTILLILGKRVLTAVTFILMVPQMLSFVFLGNNPVLSVLSGIFSIIFALILLTSKDPQKYAFAVVNVLLGAAFISNIFNSTVCSIIVGLAAAFLIWLSIACGTGKLQHSFSKHLTEDGDMTFGRCGAVIGFLLIAKMMATSFIYDYLSDSSIYTLDSVLSLGVIYVCVIAFVGAALLFIGKRQMTAVFFFGSAIVLSLDLFSSGVFSYVSVIFSLVFAVLIILRGDSLILPTFLMVADAFATLLYLQLESVPEVQTAMLLLTLGCAAVALYLSFAVFSEKPKLPVF